MPKRRHNPCSSSLNIPNSRKKRLAGEFGRFFQRKSFFRWIFPELQRLSSQLPRRFAEGSRHLYFWIGTTNTFVLLTSSLFMALAVHSIQDGNQKKLRRSLVLTFLFLVPPFSA